MRVLSVVSELYPLVKTGGLADVAGALPGAVAPHGVDMVSLLPGYPQVLPRLEWSETVHQDPALFGGPARLLRAEAAGLDLLVLDAPHLFDRPGLYAGPDGDWPDNPFRFAALCRVAAQIGQGLLPDFLPDVVHAHDWQAGLTAAYLHYDALQWHSRRPPTVFTVHNLAFQGQAAPALLPLLGLPAQAWSIDGVEAYGAINPMKAGLRFSDRVTTVSPTYAEEIRGPAQGMGLDGLLRARGDALSGILNGIDTQVWEPRADPHLAARYDTDTLDLRAVNKGALQARFGLEPRTDAPLFGMVSRLSWQKGVDLVMQAAPHLFARGAQLLVLGAGDAELEQACRDLAARYPGQCGVMMGYDETLAHLIQGGVDVLLVPSRFEPCGLTQLCALHYGAVPLVSRVGGLADTVIDANIAAIHSGAATGFQFSALTVDSLIAAAERALLLYPDRENWQRLQRNGMRADLGWRHSAMLYTQLYSQLANP